LKSRPVSLPLKLADLRTRLIGALENKAQRVLLELDDVQAEHRPGAFWEVYVGPGGVSPDPKGPFYVGLLSLFNIGIRSDAPSQFAPARFVYPVNRALQSALQIKGVDVHATFNPTSGLVKDGKLVPPKVSSPVHIGRVSIAVEALKR